MHKFPPAPETTIVPISGLHTAQSSVFSKLESIDLFGEVVAQVRQIIGADRASLFIVDSEKQELWTQVAEELTR